MPPNFHTYYCVYSWSDFNLIAFNFYICPFLVCQNKLYVIFFQYIYRQWAEVEAIIGFLRRDAVFETFLPDVEKFMPSS